MAKNPEDFHNAISKQETDVGKEAPEVPCVFPGVISSDQGCDESGVEQSSLDPLLDQPFLGVMQVPITPLREHTPQSIIGLGTSTCPQ